MLEISNAYKAYLAYSQSQNLEFIKVNFYDYEDTVSQKDKMNEVF